MALSFSFRTLTLQFTKVEPALSQPRQARFNFLFHYLQKRKKYLRESFVGSPLGQPVGTLFAPTVGLLVGRPEGGALGDL